MGMPSSLLCLTVLTHGARLSSRLLLYRVLGPKHCVKLLQHKKLVGAF